MAQERTTTHIVGSLYDFSEAAGHDVVSLFGQSSNPCTSCHFNDSNSLFTIHTPHNDDESLARLVTSMRDYISVEMNKQPDLFEDEKVIRKGGTHPKLTLAALIEKRMQTIKPNREVPLIEHENITRKWSPTSESKELGLELSLELLGRIGNLCGCRIEQASDSADLLIKADRKQDLEKGVSKLERLDKMMVDELSFPRIHSFYILEGETSVGLQLIEMQKLSDKRPVTTLLQKSFPVKSLRGLCVLVLVKGSNIVQVKLEPQAKLKPAASNQGSQLWNDHMYKCVQAQDLIATKTLKEPVTRIGKWVSDVTDSDVQMDVFRPEPAVEVQQSGDGQIVYNEPLSPTKKPTTKRTRIGRGNPESLRKTSVESKNAYDGRDATTQENMKSLNDHQSTKNVSTSKECEPQRQPPSIDPPYMPPLAISSRSLPMTPSMTSQQLIGSSYTWNVVVRGSKSGGLIDMSLPNERRAQDNKSKNEAMVVIDNLQDPNRVKAGDLKHTMNQRKARTQALVGGEVALIKSFEETTIHLLTLALPRIGRIELAVNIGRLLINQERGSSEFKNKTFKISEFSSVLPTGRTTGFEPMFTNILTTRSSEAESIMDIGQSQGRRLFQQQPASRKVTYVFSCKAKGADRIIVEYDENRDFNIQGSEVLMGALDWHFPKRAWDARLQLTSEKFLATDYQKHVKGMIDNLAIDVSEDGQLLELRIKTIDENLSIESITIRRETLHPVTIYPDLILHLTECQDLQVRQSSYSKSIYSGSIQTSNAMIKANRMWWEAKVSSINATNILKENITLELGGTAVWTPSSIINKGVVRDLFAATKEIVTRIDHVGFFNRGKRSSESKTTEKPSENTQDVPACLRRVNPAFW